MLSPGDADVKAKLNAAVLLPSTPIPCVESAAAKGKEQIA
jgi:hypothetical protein